MADKFPKVTKKNQNKPVKKAVTTFEEYVNHPSTLQKQLQTVDKIFSENKVPGNIASPTAPAEDRVLGDTEKPIESVGDLRIKEGQDLHNEIDFSKLQEAEGDLTSEISGREIKKHLPGDRSKDDLSEQLPPDLYKDYLERNPLANLSEDDLKETRKTVNAMLTGQKTIDGMPDNPFTVDFTQNTYGETALEYKRKQYSVGMQALESIGESVVRGGLLFAKGIPTGIGTALNYAFEYTPTSEQIDRINAAIMSDPKVAEAFGNQMLKIEDPNLAEKTGIALGNIIAVLPSFGRSAPKIAEELAPFFNPTKLKNLHGVKKLIGVGQNIAKQIPQMGLQFTTQSFITGTPSTDPFTVGASFGTVNAITDAVTESLPAKFRLTKFIRPVAQLIMGGVGFSEGERLNDMIHGNLKPYEDYIPALINGMGLKGWHQFTSKVQSAATDRILNSEYVKWYQGRVKVDVLNNLISGSEKKLEEITNLQDYSALTGQIEKAKKEREAIKIEQNALAQKINDLAKDNGKNVRQVPGMEKELTLDPREQGQISIQEMLDVTSRDMQERGITDPNLQLAIKSVAPDLLKLKEELDKLPLRSPEEGGKMTDFLDVVKKVDNITADLQKSTNKKYVPQVKEYVMDTLFPDRDPAYDISDNLFMEKTKGDAQDEAAMNLHKQIFGEVGQVKMVEKIMDGKNPVNSAGYYKDMTIQVLKNLTKRVVAVGHEDWHFLRDNYLTEQQKEYLDKNTKITNTKLLERVNLINNQVQDRDITPRQHQQEMSDIKEEQQGLDFMMMVDKMEVKGDIDKGQLTDQAKTKLVYASMMGKIKRFIQLGSENKSMKEVSADLLRGKFANKAPVGEPRIPDGKELSIEDYNKYLGKTPEEQAAHFSSPMTSLDKYGTFEADAFEKTKKRLAEQFPDRTPKQIEKLALQETKGKRAVQKDVDRQTKAEQNQAMMTPERILNWDVVKDGVPNDAQFTGTILLISDEVKKIGTMNPDAMQTLPPDQQYDQLSYMQTKWKNMTDMMLKKNNMLSEAARVVRLGNNAVVAEDYVNTMDSFYRDLTLNIEAVGRLKAQALKRIQEIQTAGVDGILEGRKLSLEDYDAMLAQQKAIIEKATGVQKLMEESATGDKKSDYVLAKIDNELKARNYKMSGEDRQVMIDGLKEINGAESELRLYTADILGEVELNRDITKEQTEKYVELQMKLNDKQAEFDRSMQLLMPTEISKALLTDLKLNIMGIQTLMTNVTNNIGFGLARLQDSMTESGLRRVFDFAARVTGNERLQQDIADLNNRPTKLSEMKNWGRDWTNAFTETLKTFSDAGLTSQFYEKTEVGLHHRLDPKAKMKQALGKEIIGGSVLMPNLLNSNKGIAAYINRLGLSDMPPEQMNMIGQKFMKGVEGFLEMQPYIVGKGLSLGDKPFYQAEYNKFLTRSLMKTGISESQARLRMPFASDAQKQEADARARESIYAESNVFNKAYNMTLKFMEGTDLPAPAKKTAAYILGTIFPFTKIPYNVAKRTLEYALPIFPLMFGIAKLSEAKHLTGKARVDALEKGMRRIATSMTGTSYLAMGSVLMNLGVLTGAYFSDEKERELTNGQPLELNVSRLKRLIASGFQDDGKGWQDNDKTLKMLYLGIPGVVMSAGASMFRDGQSLPLSLEIGGKAYDENNPNENTSLMNKIMNAVTQAPTTSLKMALEQTSLYGFDGILQAIKDENMELPKVQYMIATAASAPFVSRNAIDLTNWAAGENQYQRDARYEPDFDAIHKRLGELGAPLWDDTPAETLPYSYDVMGQKKYSAQGKFWQEGDYFPSFYIFGTVHKSPEKLQMQELYQKSGDKNIVPPRMTPDIKLKDGEFKIPKEDYETFQQNVGDKRMQELGTTAEGIDKLEGQEKKDAIKKLISKFNSIREKEVETVKKGYQLK